MLYHFTILHHHVVQQHDQVFETTNDHIRCESGLNRLQQKDLYHCHVERIHRKLCEFRIQKSYMAHHPEGVQFEKRFGILKTAVTESTWGLEEEVHNLQKYHG